MVLEETDKGLLEGCQRGEPDALRVLFEAHKDKVYSVALRYSGDPTVAMDIAQDAFLKLFSAIRTFRGNNPRNVMATTRSRRVAAICQRQSHPNVTDEQERQAVAEVVESLKRNGGVPMEVVLADFGLTLEEFRRMADDDSPEVKQA